MGEYLIGADIGTGSTKTVLVDTDGRLLATASAEYPMRHPHPGWAENDPDDWYRAVLKTVKEVVVRTGVRPTEVACLTLGSQRDPVVLLDAKDQPLTPSISWTDRRTVAVMREVAEAVGPEKLISISGMAPIPGVSGPNLIWTKRNLPDVFAKCRHVLFPKDYVRYRLLGVIETDHSTPSRSMLIDVRTRDWSLDLCEAFEVPPEILPPLREPWELAGKLGRTAASSLGLAAGTPVCLGGGDDPCGALGAGCIRPGDINLGTGTASSWRLVTADVAPDLSGRMDFSFHVVPGLYMYEGVIFGTGSSVRWFKDRFGQDLEEQARRQKRSVYTLLDELAASVEPGSGGLVFFPYLFGLRMPYYQPEASGAYVGISLGHGRSHFVRAIMEGVAYQYVESLRLFGRRCSLGRITMVGGETRSRVWTQIKADVTGREIHVPENVETSALGAAMLGGQAVGVFGGAEEAVRRMVKQVTTCAPDPARHELYAQLYRLYSRVYENISRCFEDVERAADLSFRQTVDQDRPVGGGRSDWEDHS